MDKVCLNIFGLDLLEPMTFVTDLLVAVFCFIYYYKIRNIDIKEFDNKYFKLFFIIFGLSTLIAGFAHIFYNYLGITPHIISWILSGLSIYYIEMCSITFVKSEKIKKYLNHLIYIQLFLFTFSIIYFKQFQFVKYNSFIGLILFVLILELISLIKSSNKGSWFIIIGIFFTFLSAIVHSIKFSIHKWFNYNDLSHIFLLLCIYFLYAGAMYKIKLNEQEYQLKEDLILYST